MSNTQALFGSIFYRVDTLTVEKVYQPLVVGLSKRNTDWMEAVAKNVHPGLRYSGIVYESDRPEIRYE